MPLVNDRFLNKIDGTYVNAPDLHSIEPSKNIGLKEMIRQVDEDHENKINFKGVSFL